MCQAMINFKNECIEYGKEQGEEKYKLMISKE